MALWMSILLLTCACAVPFCSAARAGRALPIDAEDYITEQFEVLNPKLTYDDSNYLVDLSGQTSNCNFVQQTGPFVFPGVTREQETIGGLRDAVEGHRADVDAVNLYVKEMVDRWTNRGDDNYVQHRVQIETATKFGCSVSPRCKTRDGRRVAVISCLFSPKANGENEDQKNPTARPVHAQAFTKEQYNLAKLYQKEWDRSHFLENLSGKETSCEMLNVDVWSFEDATREAKENYGRIVSGQYGSEPNNGNVPRAIQKIVSSWTKEMRGSRVGCSLIPDCDVAGEETVVVSCLFEEV